MLKLFGGLPNISTAELAGRLKEGLTLLDVRTPSEYRSGHIATPQNVPLDKIDGYRQKPAEDIYVICQSGMRSKKAARILQKKGYSVVNVRGGMNQWNGKTRGGK